MKGFRLLLAIPATNERKIETSNSAAKKLIINSIMWCGDHIYVLSYSNDLHFIIIKIISHWVVLIAARIINQNTCNMSILILYANVLNCFNRSIPINPVHIVSFMLAQHWTNLTLFLILWFFEGLFAQFPGLFLIYYKKSCTVIPSKYVP